MSKAEKPQKQATAKRGGNPNPPPPPVAHQFKPGASGNPGGKPVNARNRLTKRFLETLADDFEANGKQAVEAAREQDPIGYVRAVASLMPKEFVVERPLDGLTDDELAAAITELRSRLGRLEGAGDRAATPDQPQQAGPVPAVH